MDEIDPTVDLTRIPKPSERVRVENPLGEECYIGLPVSQVTQELTWQEIEDIGRSALAGTPIGPAVAGALCETALAATKRADNLAF